MSYQTSNQIKICLVEDDTIIREGFELLLNENQGFKVVNSYNNCEDFLKNLHSDKPNVVLMDIELPGMNGIEGIERVKKLYPQAQVIVVTVYENDALVFKALCAGAGGYLTKNMPPSRLIDAIREIMGGGAPMSTNIARLVVASFQKNHNSPLSARETEVLELLSKGKSYTNIAEDLFIDKETVRTHIKNIYWKLEVHSKAEAIEKAVKEKLI
jgi:DNA-binding NarL/FixJ family response regulator